MRKLMTLSALAALIALPLIAGPTDAEASCRSRKLNGAVLGGVGGALLGGAVTHGSTGPIVAGVGGAVVGHEIGRNGCGRKAQARYERRQATRHAHNQAPRAVQKVYYDQYGNVVRSESIGNRR